MGAHNTERYGLGEPAMLEKIDKLFACGVGESVDLPQIVVVGDQSSGKSSVLEGLINKPLPRDSGLCTRFATQIVFRRAAEEKIFVSIIPDRSASAEHSSRMKAWGKLVPSLDSKAFTSIMQEVHTEMGLSDNNPGETRRPTFSTDVLHLEISGPDQEHLSVIDVPGIFKSTTKGLTTKEDILMVRNMVKGYMDNPRSVILAVIPANVDIATQEILELAAEADPPGDRTLGVLTKPDLVDKGAEPRVIDLIEDRARSMQLGWHMIRNPGQKQLSDGTLNRSVLETDFFRSHAPWNTIAKDKVGVDSLRIRLKEVLSSLVKREFPKVKGEIKNRLALCQKRLGDLGPERNGAAEQMAYLTAVASKFQSILFMALNANYGADDVFNSRSSMRIIPKILSRMETFSEEMRKYGETYSFLAEGSDDEITPLPEFTSLGKRLGLETSPTTDKSPVCLNIRKEDDVEELVDILYPPEGVKHPVSSGIKTWLFKVFRENRGFELGTFNATILATTMKKQSSKWKDLSFGYVSDVIVLVHRYIMSALRAVCPDDNIRKALVSTLGDGLIERYQKAIDASKLLLEVENGGTPMTMNHYFNDNLQKSRSQKFSADLKKKSFHVPDYGNIVKVDSAPLVHSMSNGEHVVEEVHDILKSYYKVTRKTFVDNMCKIVVDHHLLNCESSPLKLFSPIFVSGLSSAELEEIAGEAPGVKRLRAQLKVELASLTEATKILARA